MADSLSSLCPPETRSYSALLLWKVLKILLSLPHFLLPLIQNTRDVICSHVHSDRLQSLKLMDISVSKAKYHFVSSHSVQVELDLSHHMMAVSGTHDIAVVLTLDNLYDNGTTTP